MTQALLQAVEEIRPVIEEHAQAAEADRQLADEVYDAMYRAGLFGMLAPKAYGGLEVHRSRRCRSGKRSHALIRRPPGTW